MYQNDNLRFFIRLRASVQVFGWSASQVFVEVLQGGGVRAIAHFKKGVPNAGAFSAVTYFQELFYPVTVQVFLVTGEPVLPDYRGQGRTAYIQQRGNGILRKSFPRRVFIVLSFLAELILQLLNGRRSGFNVFWASVTRGLTDVGNLCYPSETLFTSTGRFRNIVADSLNFSSDSVVKKRQPPCRVQSASISGCRCR